MGLIVIGINHRTAPVKVREKFSLTRKELTRYLVELKNIDMVLGAILLSTCNRMEIYLELADDNLGLEKIKSFILNHWAAKENEIKQYFYILGDAQAIGHIFKVASGLDSQVLGETQILAQVKSAWETAKNIGTVNNALGELFKKAVDVGKRVRLETKISEGNISIASIAIKICESHFGDLQSKEVLIIGAGKIGTLLSRYFKEKYVRGIFVSNRTYERAGELASICQGEAINFDQLKGRLQTVDIVISSTASPHLILGKETLAEIMQTRDNPLLLIDLALPRDIDPEVRGISGISLYDLDDLKSVVEENHLKRKNEAKFAQAIIQDALTQYGF